MFVKVGMMIFRACTTFDERMMQYVYSLRRVAWRVNEVQETQTGIQGLTTKECSRTRNLLTTCCDVTLGWLTGATW